MAESPETSLTLLQSLQRSTKDSIAWQRFADAYEPWLRAWLRLQSLQAHDIDDLMQNWYVVVLRELPGFEHSGRPGAFRCWLKTILENVLRSFRAANRRHPVTLEDSAVEQLLAALADKRSDVSKSLDEGTAQTLLRHVWNHVKRDLDSVTQRAFEMRAFEDLPAAEVAKELGISVETVYRAKHRVFKRLREVGKGLID